MIKLDQARSGTSFYESFSDLIFATMAVFVLLMIIFLVQINLDIGLDELLAQIDEQQEELVAEEARQEAEVVRSTLLAKSKAGLERYQFEVVIAVDTTGSMQLELDLLADTIGLIGRILPRIAATAKIGVIAYRRDENDRVQIATFPLQRILDPDVDNQRSFQRLHGFVRQLRARAGSAPIEEAVDQAVKMFSSVEAFTGHQTLMILGDVGPYEDRYQDQSIDARNRAQEQSMRRQLRVWAKASLDRNVLVLFSGDDEIAKTQGDQKRKFERSREFFKSLADAVEQPKGFSNNPADMIPSLLSAILN